MFRSLDKFSQLADRYGGYGARTENRQPNQNIKKEKKKRKGKK